MWLDYFGRTLSPDHLYWPIPDFVSPQQWGKILSNRIATSNLFQGPHIHRVRYLIQNQIDRRTNLQANFSFSDL